MRVPTYRATIILWIPDRRTENATTKRKINYIVQQQPQQQRWWWWRLRQESLTFLCVRLLRTIRAKWFNNLIFHFHFIFLVLWFFEWNESIEWNICCQEINRWNANWAKLHKSENQLIERRFIQIQNRNILFLGRERVTTWARFGKFGGFRSSNGNDGDGLRRNY